MEASALASRQVSPAHWLRPAEWVALLFMAYLLVRLAIVGQVDLGSNTPRVDMGSALMLAVLAGQISRYRRVPWPESSPFVAKHWLLFPFTLLPLVLQLPEIAHVPDWNETRHNGGYMLEVLFSLHWLIRRFAFMGLPLVLLWLALGVHIKQNDGVRSGAFASEVGRGFVSAVRDWAPPVALSFFYGLLGSVLQHTGIPDQDAHLAAIDRFLFLGHDPVRELQRIASVPVSEWMAFSYGFYAPMYPLCFGLLYARKDQRGFHELALAITLGLALGYVGYTIVPALGPAFTNQTFDVDLGDYYFKWVKADFIDRVRVPHDAFPSLHTCTSFIFLWAARRHSKPLFWFLLPMVATVPIACMYLRYHYFADIVAGTALFAAVAWATPRLLDRNDGITSRS